MDKHTFDVCIIFFTGINTDARTLNLAATLAGNGVKVCIIACGTDKDVKDLGSRNITLFPIRQPGSKKFRYKWLHYLSGIRKYKKKADASIFLASDFFVLYFAKQLASRHKAKLLYDSREIYSALGPLSNNPLKQGVIASLERKLIRSVDEIIVSGHLDADYLQKYYNLKKRPFVLLNLPPYKPPVKSDILRQKYNIDSKKIILLYQGMLLPGRGLLPVVSSLVFNDDVVFCILGEGSLKDQIAGVAESLKVRDRVILCGKVPYEELHSYTCSADIGMLCIEPISYSYELALPNKLFEYCMASIPSLVSDLPAMREILEEHPIGRLIPSDSSPESIANAIKDIQSDKEKYIEACKSASKLYSYESQEKPVMDFFGKYLSNNKTEESR